MNKRYQIFISSTFRDLKKERQAALDAIIELGHFPAGMEVFPAADSTPWELIETIIAESDYYALIIGGVYGSTDENGISYTEREYDYAISKGIPVIAFLHGDPAKIPSGMVEMNPSAQKKLKAFRKKVEMHHCKYWVSDAELKSQILLGLVHAIRVNPRIGWIHGNKGDSAETLQKLNKALEENNELRAEIKAFRDEIAIKNSSNDSIASGNDHIVLTLIDSHTKEEHKCKITWNDLFLIIGPTMLSDSKKFVIQDELTNALSIKNFGKRKNNIYIEQNTFDKIIYQFLALEFVEPTTWHTQTEDAFNKQTRTVHVRGFRLTRKGVTELGRLNAIKKTK